MVCCVNSSCALTPPTGVAAVAARKGMCGCTCMPTLLPVLGSNNACNVHAKVCSVCALLKTCGQLFLAAAMPLEGHPVSQFRLQKGQPSAAALI
jgi:hypothetical protein